MTQLNLPTDQPGLRDRPALHLVVSCTNRKRHRPAPSLMVRNLPTGPVRRRAREWIRRLDSAESPRGAAAELYAGDHWATVARLPELGAEYGYATDLSVLSAGYGLIPARLPITPYAATFSGSSPDSVGTGDEAIAWWNTLTAATELAPGYPRSLSDLASIDPSVRILLVAAPPYLHPIAADAVEAAHRLDSEEQLMVVSAGGRSSSNGLTPFLLPFDSRLTQVVGGSRVSLNARTAALVLESAGETGLRRRAVVDFLGTHLAGLRPPVVYNRTRMTDDEVSAYLHDRLSVDSSASATRLLRELRDGGRACEQHRFHDLVREAKESHG